jgi:hypothetical protein
MPLSAKVSRMPAHTRRFSRVTVHASHASNVQSASVVTVDAPSCLLLGYYSTVNTDFITIRKSTKRICVMNAPMVSFWSDLRLCRSFKYISHGHTKRIARRLNPSFLPSTCTTITGRRSPWGTIVPASHRVRRFAFTLLGHGSDPRLRYQVSRVATLSKLGRNQLA